MQILKAVILHMKGVHTCNVDVKLRPSMWFMQHNDPISHVLVNTGRGQFEKC